ncbi:hypothetical protein JYT35_00805 [Acidimicrobium ferrooxidans]|uniref:Secreted protein n=1 Tax=Acidimicrobium ferrooxidans TaxID=53635 RepID=A0ABS3AQ51_9ACTN|nr:hypothetical protein [Acidimicrobium ferrooxidans]
MTAIVTALSGIAVVLIIFVTMAAIASSIAQRLLDVRHVNKRSEVRGRRHELHWTAIRLRNQGFMGRELQEGVCMLGNCTPADADAAILRVGAEL